MISKKSIRVALSAFLLLCFSVAVIPLDFLHNHAEEQSRCSSKHVTCQHKIHISKKASYCFACTVHLDKAFTFSYPLQSFIKPSITKLLSSDCIAGCYTKVVLSFLRGPPSHNFSKQFLIF